MADVPPQSRIRAVLIVDDDDDIREVMRDILAVRGYPVVAVANGRQALEWLRSGGQPCMILLDLMMPEMNGWEFREEQLRDPDIADIPVVVITGMGPLRNRLEVLHAEQVLPKPLNLTRLVEAIARHC